MWHVDDKQYRMEKISSSTSMQYGKGRIFYERKLSEDGEINTEVILIQKVNGLCITVTRSCIHAHLS